MARGDQAGGALLLSAVCRRPGLNTVAEIQYGIARLPSGQRRATLSAAAGKIFTALPDQILPFDLAAAHAYADIVSHRDRLGTTRHRRE